MGSIFKPDVPDEPKIDTAKIASKERLRRLRMAGHSSTNIVSNQTLGGTNNAT